MWHMAASPVSLHTLELAQASFARCLNTPGFFQAFYDRFLASDPAIPPYFTNTRFDRQGRLLQHGVGLLLVYARSPDPSMLQRIRDEHGPAGHNIPAALYPPFLEAFLATVRAHDADCDATVEAAWRESLAPGVAFVAQGSAG